MIDKDSRIIACVYSSLKNSLDKDDNNVADYLMSEFVWSKKGALPKIKEHLKQAIENNGDVIKYLNGMGKRVCRRLDVSALERVFYLFEKYERIKKCEKKL